MLDVVSGGGDRGDASQSPVKDASSLDSSSESGSSKALNFDLLNMVVSYKRMAIFLEPVTDALEVLRYLLGWRLPLCSLLCCILLNILFITLSQVAWFSVLLLVVSVPAVLGYVGERCHGDASETALQKKKHYAVQRRELQTVNISRQEAMLEVKSLLKQLDDLLTQACGYAESVYKVLYWESHATSSVFYGFLLMMVCLLYSAPVGWSLSLVNSALFLWNRDFCRVLLQMKSFFHSSSSQPAEGDTERSDTEPGNLLDRTPTPTSLEDLSPGSVEEAEEAEPDDEFKDAIEVFPAVIGLWRRIVRKDDEETVSVCSSDYDSVSDNGLLSRNEPIRSKVSKLTEKLRKRVPTNPTGNCSSCAAAFSVLKKRRHCTNCGVSFCSRCCSFKVFKSSMGATAPEAQRETVFVCAMCNAALSSK
ncbi:protrudin isoform X1 [Astyanax mexicanus]|uniref:Protrudin n=1 Tax=Astyanax mexicanus TaxID=7994 RepID=A0A8B9JBS4_ASTMX|nr:protrudin isoform X1 [Astyanax mexicanus]KAG9262673.1 protrudin isoform X1 [Astyanax mexicanus]